MAIANSVQLTGSMRFVNESVSLVTSAGDNSSFRTVPQGFYWELQTMRGLNGDTVARDISFLLVDQDGTLHGHMSMAATARATIPSTAELSWNGSMIIPPGWRVYCKWFAMAAGQTCNWQYTAIEKPLI